MLSYHMGIRSEYMSPKAKNYRTKNKHQWTKISEYLKKTIAAKNYWTRCQNIRTRDNSSGQAIYFLDKVQQLLDSNFQNTRYAKNFRTEAKKFWNCCIHLFLVFHVSLHYQSNEGYYWQLSQI
ncbi:Hypothetical_protein [Hexamita inflata]|uniref:Hypothetical_protein n=1 Tax=Hexamita inflata TaxID=28002 RepID=A0AA86TQY3_9EUKA|nr:Hypothetical protein HINF_LOCUS13514 [Hexamita inflata]